MVLKRLFRFSKGEAEKPAEPPPAPEPADAVGAETAPVPPPAEPPAEATPETTMVAERPAELPPAPPPPPEVQLGHPPATAAEPTAPAADAEGEEEARRQQHEEAEGRERRGLFARFGFGRREEADAATPPAVESPLPAPTPPPPSLAAEPPSEATAEGEENRERRGFFSRLKAGLARSSAKIGSGIAALFRDRLMDDAALDGLEELLITADLGTSAAKRIVDRFRIARFGAHVSEREVKEALAAEIADILRPVAVPLVPNPAHAPHVVLVVGVNGTGKTTTIAKLAALWSAQGLKPMLVAGDTFRAAAVEQLTIWGERTSCPVIAGPPNADAAGLAYDALARARTEGADVLLIDTAGRLHNKADLMAELGKIVRVLRKQVAEAPHSVLLVLDATTGQNALSQVKVFREMVDVTGLIVTKLDGSAKGGVVVALAETFGLPVHAVGVGEKAEDLRPFDPDEFARSLVGLDEAG